MSKYDVRFQRKDKTKVAMGCDRFEVFTASDGLNIRLFDSTMRAGHFQSIGVFVVEPGSITVNGDKFE